MCQFCDNFFEQFCMNFGSLQLLFATIYSRPIPINEESNICRCSGIFIPVELSELEYIKHDICLGNCSHKTIKIGSIPP